MKQICIILVLFFATISVYSQIEDIYNDYIITLEHDTIYGEVYIKSNSKILFNNSNEKKAIKAKHILGYKKGLKKRIVKNIGEHPTGINDQPVFVTKVITGEVTLYRLGDPLLTNYILYYLEKDNSILKANNISLSEYFKDYKELSLSIENKCYSINDLPKIVRIYNEWCNNGINSIPPELLSDSLKGFSPGFVIEKDGNDTIHGYLQFSLFKDYILFYDKDMNFKKYIKSRNYLIGYSINNNFYKHISSYIPGFIKEYIHGKLSLYSCLYNRSYMKPDGTFMFGGTVLECYLVKEGETKPVKIKERKLAEYFKDNKKLYEKIYYGYYDITNIETIVCIYNNTSN